MRRSWSWPCRALLWGAGMGACQPADVPESAPTAAVETLAANDALILAASRIAMPPEGILPEDLPDASSPGAGLLLRYCAQCHLVPAPTMHSQMDWPGVVRRMWLRMDHLPPQFGIQVPDLADRVAILTYLTSHALEVSEATLPDRPGREEFVMTCSQCHALPSPTLHSAQDWIAVFQRMERNMERMRVQQPSRTQVDAILSYLGGVSGG